jgi:signal transduction histidine kinase
VSHLKSEILDFVKSSSFSTKKQDFGRILISFFDEVHPELKSHVLRFSYAPECYKTLSENEGDRNCIKILNSSIPADFSIDKIFLKLNEFLIYPLFDYKNQLQILIIFESPLKDNIDALVHLVQDITAVYKYVTKQEDESISSVYLKAANLVSRLSHDINSLIALIPQENTKEDALNARINYSEKLSREIMYYLREMSVEKSEVPIEDLLSGIISGIDFPSNVVFSKNILKEIGLIDLDVELMDRAVTAIVDNAIFATHIEGGSIEMSVGINKNKSPFISHDWLEIVITDNGPGIAAEFLREVKKPLFTTWKDQGHVGLGVSIADKIVNAHYGHLMIESKQDQGTRAIIHLPLRKADEEK